MIFADQIQPLGILIAIAGVLGLGVSALFLFRSWEHFAQRSLERKYADLEIHAVPQVGDVLLTYHTYHGLIAWFTQTPHHVALPPDDARKLLGRLLRFNCTWGLVTYGVLFIPPVAILSYLAQRRSIADQEANGGMTTVDTKVSTDLMGHEVTQSPSLFYRVVGWLTASLCVIFAISAIVCLVAAEFKDATGGAALAALFGWTSRDWLCKGRGVR